MPLPKPNKNEEKQKFISRCISELTHNNEFTSHEQRIAVCFSVWDRNNEDIINKIDKIIEE